MNASETQSAAQPIQAFAGLPVRSTMIALFALIFGLLMLPAGQIVGGRFMVLSASALAVGVVFGLLAVATANGSRWAYRIGAFMLMFVGVFAGMAIVQSMM
jgi:hypothetical protein